MPKGKTKGPLPPIKVRQEPPTIEEAVFAAQALTPDREQQVEIAAGLMSLSLDEVRPHVEAAPPLPPAPSAEPRRTLGLGRTETSVRTAGRVVVVERRSRFPVGAPRS